MCRFNRPERAAGAASPMFDGILNGKAGGRSTSRSCAGASFSPARRVYFAAGHSFTSMYVPHGS